MGIIFSCYVVGRAKRRSHYRFWPPVSLYPFFFFFPRRFARLRFYIFNQYFFFFSSDPKVSPFLFTNVPLLEIGGWTGRHENVFRPGRKPLTLSIIQSGSLSAVRSVYCVQAVSPFLNGDIFRVNVFLSNDPVSRDEKKFSRPEKKQGRPCFSLK